MRKPWHILILLSGLAAGGLLLSSCTAGGAQTKQLTPQQAEEASLNADIHRLLKANGATEMGLKIINQMIVSFKRGNPTVPGRFFEEFGRQINPEDVFAYLTPVYARHFSHDEILQMVAFYESPVGVKMMSQMDALGEETMMADSQWTDALAQKLAAAMQKKGYIRT